MPNHEDPLMQDDFDQTPSQRDGGSSGRFASESDAIEAKKKKGKLILFGGVVVIVGVVVAATLHFLHQPTAPMMQPTPPALANHPVFPKKKALPTAVVAPTTASNPVASNPLTANPLVTNPATPSSTLSASGTTVSNQSATNPMATLVAPVASPVSAPNTSPNTATVNAPVTSPNPMASTSDISKESATKDVSKESNESLANNPLFATAKTPVVATPVTAPNASVTPSSSTSTLSAPVQSTASPSNTPAFSLTAPASTNTPATAGQVDALSGQVHTLDNKVDQLDTRVSHLETKVNGSPSVTEVKTEAKNVNKKSDKSSEKSKAPAVFHKARVHHYYKPKNDIEILSDDNHASNESAVGLRPALKANPWSQTKGQEFKVSAVSDGRAWLKTSDGSFTTVMVGSSLSDGRKVTKITDDGVWVDGKKLP